jgi:hypothetical protein
VSGSVFGHEEAVRVEPGFGEPSPKVLALPAALIREVRERHGIGVEPLVFIISHLEGAKCEVVRDLDRGKGGEERSSHLPQDTAALEALRYGDPLGGIAVAVGPETKVIA